MISCERIQAVILTDYIDNQLSAAKKKEVEDHLIACLSCRTYAARVKKDLEIFDEIKPVEADPFLWQQVKRRIEKESNLEHAGARKIDFINGFLLNLKPYGVSFILLLMLGFGVIVKQNAGQHEPYLSYVFASESQGADEERTNIEQYFL